MAPGRFLGNPGYKGMAAGFFCALLSLVFMSLGDGGEEPFYTIGSFLAASPLLLLLPSDLPDILSCTVILLYWLSIGALIGWLLGRPNKLVRRAGFVCIAGVMTAHAVTLNVIMNMLGDRLAEGIGRMFQTMITG